MAPQACPAPRTGSAVVIRVTAQNRFEPLR